MSHYIEWDRGVCSHANLKSAINRVVYRAITIYIYIVIWVSFELPFTTSESFRLHDELKVPFVWVDVIQSQFREDGFLG